jgi:hypothetical protein
VYQIVILTNFLKEFMTNPKKSVELTFTPIHEGRAPFKHRVSKSVLEKLQKARPITLEDLQRIMQGLPPLPPDASTITICNKWPS